MSDFDSEIHMPNFDVKILKTKPNATIGQSSSPHPDIVTFLWIFYIVTKEDGLFNVTFPKQRSLKQ